MLRYTLPALAAAGSAMAASCSISSTTTIQNAGDASAIGACTTFSGDVTVATGTIGDLMFNPSLERIAGDFNVVNAPNVTSLSGTALKKVDGTMKISNVQKLGSITFNDLELIGSIDWEGLPQLGSLQLATTTNTTSFNLQNTRLQNLDGIDLANCSNFYLANNLLLQQFSMQLESVPGSITLQGNGNRMNATFPNLVSADNITIDDVAAFDLSSLKTVNGSISFDMNNDLTEIDLPKLTAVQEGFTINSNTGLKNYSVPKLETVGGAISVQNNTVLDAVTFPSLVKVGGAFNAYGNFSTVSLPKITDIEGNFNVQSTQDLTESCDKLNSQKGSNNVLRGGDYTCDGKNPTPSGTGNGDTSGNGGGDGSSSSNGNSNAAGPARVPAMEITAVLGLVAAIAAIM